MQSKTSSLAIVSALAAAGLFAFVPSVHATGTPAHARGAATASTRTATSAVPARAATVSNNPATRRQNAADQNRQSRNTMDCQMDFTLSGWSAIYKTSSGQGTVTCDNGQTMHVRLSAKGAGLSAGAYKINDGHGKFTNVTNINQILGTYVKGTAHVGASKSTRAAIMTNDNVSLALTGTGNGWDIGVAITGFTISRASTANAGMTGSGH